jgi:hypothetical protein
MANHGCVNQLIRPAKGHIQGSNRPFDNVRNPLGPSSGGLINVLVIGIWTFDIIWTVEFCDLGFYTVHMKTNRIQSANSDLTLPYRIAAER